MNKINSIKYLPVEDMWNNIKTNIKLKPSLKEINS